MRWRCALLALLLTSTLPAAEAETPFLTVLSSGDGPGWAVVTFETHGQKVVVRVEAGNAGAAQIAIMSWRGYLEDGQRLAEPVILQLGPVGPVGFVGAGDAVAETGVRRPLQGGAANGVTFNSGHSNDHGVFTVALFALGDIEDRLASIRYGPGVSILNVTHGEGGVALRASDFRVVGAGAGAGLAAARAMDGVATVSHDGVFLGGFGTELVMGSAHREVETPTGERRTCRCIFDAPDGPTSLPPGTSTFRVRDVSASLPSSDPFLVWGAVVVPPR